MSGSFETSDANQSEHHRPLRVPSRREGIWDALKEMVEDLEGWSVVSSDEESRVVVCEKSGGLLAGTSRLTITVEGDAEVPSTTVHAKSTTNGGLIGRDKANVAHFIKLFHRRVC